MKNNEKHSAKHIDKGIHKLKILAKKYNGIFKDYYLYIGEIIMKLEDVENIIKEMFETQFDIVQVEDFEKNYFDGIIANSIDALEFLIKIEKRFDICIDDEDLSADLIQSLSKISNYVYKKLTSV